MNAYNIKLFIQTSWNFPARGKIPPPFSRKSNVQCEVPCFMVSNSGLLILQVSDMLISGTYITVIYVPANFNKPIHQRKANTCPILIFHNIYSPFQRFCRVIKRKLKFVSYKPRLNCDQKYKYRKYIVYIQKIVQI